LILADTSAFVALFDRDQAAHERVRDAWTRLAGQEPIVSHSYVLGETVSLLQRRLGLGPVADFRDAIEPALEVVWIDQELHDLAMTATLATVRRRVSIVDHASFVVMRRLGLTRAFALDAHFAEQGFELVPAPV